MHHPANATALARNHHVNIQGKALPSIRKSSLPARITGAIVSLVFLLVLEFALIKLIFTHA